MRAAIRHGVAIGAHPSYPDRAGFGRVAMERSPDEIFDDVLEQTRRLATSPEAQGARLTHVKAHGALYNVAARDRAVADAISRAVLAFDPELAIVGACGRCAAAQRAHPRLARDF